MSPALRCVEAFTFSMHPVGRLAMEGEGKGSFGGILAAKGMSGSRMGAW